MRTNYVLIDFESVQTTSLELLTKEHFKVIVFVGANQGKLPRRGHSYLSAINGSTFVALRPGM